MYKNGDQLNTSMIKGAGQYVKLADGSLLLLPQQFMTNIHQLKLVDDDETKNHQQANEYQQFNSPFTSNDLLGKSHRLKQR